MLKTTCFYYLKIYEFLLTGFADQPFIRSQLKIKGEFLNN